MIGLAGATAIYRLPHLLIGSDAPVRRRLRGEDAALALCFHCTKTLPLALCVFHCLRG